MTENVLEKIIQNKKKNIINLKRNISLDSLNDLIDQNKTFINFKLKIENNIKNSKFSIIAEIKKEVVGIALIYPRYSTWTGAAMHLEDLIVTEKHRGKGIGFALFSKFIKYSYNQKVNRVQWVVLDWNQSAIEFYKNNGAQVLNDWRVALMDENAIKKFVENESI